MHILNLNNKRFDRFHVYSYPHPTIRAIASKLSNLPVLVSGAENKALSKNKASPTNIQRTRKAATKAVDKLRLARETKKKNASRNVNGAAVRQKK